jgi:hypothetical protein
MPQLKRLKHMAAELQVSRASVRMMIASGMPAIQRGRLLWLDPEKVHAWLNKFERNSPRKINL